MKTPEQRSFHRRLIAFTVVVLAVLLIFAARLVWLQLVRGDDYYAEATAPPSSAASAAQTGNKLRTQVSSW